MNCQAPSKFSALVFVCAVLALPLPQAELSHADPDDPALQEVAQAAAAAIQIAEEQEAVPELRETPPGGGAGIDEAELEARIVARLRHQMHGQVEDLAMRSLERAMRQLRDRDGAGGARPLGKVLRLTFELKPSIEGVAPVSVVTRTSAYSAFADTFAKGAGFRLNVVGDLGLSGLHQDRVTIDFSTLLQFSQAGDGETGSSGATGSAEMAIGDSEVLMSVGARDLVLTVTEE